MRIQSVKEVSTQQQPNPFSLQKVDSATAGKNASLSSFKECLRTQILDSRNPAATRNAESAAVSSLWNYFIPQRASVKPELRLKPRIYLSLSDL